MTAKAKKVSSPAAQQDQVIGFELSPALVAFRRTAGDANRHLNTLLVAIETLTSTTPIKPKGLAVPWTKPGVKKEWDDSRDYVLKGCMVALVDGLDQYMRVLSRIPGLTAPELNDTLNGRKEPGDQRRPTVAERLEALASHYPKTVPKEYIAALYLLVTWRNQFVHRDYRFDLGLSIRKTLTGAAPGFAKGFQGTDITSALKRFGSREPPSLNDLAFLIAIAQRTVRLMDEHLLQLQNGADYATALMRYLIASSEDPKAFVEDTWMYGGNRSAGRVHALFLDNGGNHDPDRSPNAPSITRKKLNDLFAFGRVRARHLFGSV
ncbi:hypothetical protein HAP48_0011130 [Bradyrhizobium septentrionale]|uniref:Uncharacterized protein n=1 Tax=Bradyrhizobium septentrionale TaxID=1404411 RepID=A0A973W803_9BRAD|nr:hypothetical protein [Bradyrhizobium septentrionale]UGY17928.1 hypothetical protein HAP48_0011130 [Bradyrhizobium septentrionale]